MDYKEQRRAMRRISAEQDSGIRIAASELAIIMEDEFFVSAEIEKKIDAELDAEEL